MPFPPSQPPQRPEPAIYSPLYEISQDRPPTWNSPDIRMYSDFKASEGSWQQLSLEEQGSSLHDATVTLHNESDVDAVNVSVKASCRINGLSFGCIPISLMTQLVTVPANAQAEMVVSLRSTQQLLAAQFPNLYWTSPAIFIDIDHPYDSNPDDNHGQNNCLVEIFEQSGVPAGTVEAADLHLNNGTEAAANFNLAIIGPNSLGAIIAGWAPGSSFDTIPAGPRFTVPPNSYQSIALAFAFPSALTNTDITVIARDDDGNFLDGCTVRLYIGA